MNRLRSLRARGRYAVAGLAALAVAGTAFAAGSSSGGKLVIDASPVIRIRVDSPLLFQQHNSGGNAPVLVAQDLVPGEPRSGSTMITNAGALDGRYKLTASDLTDAAGANGGVLSGTLRLRIAEQKLASSSTVYDGTLAGLSTLDLGIFLAGESRTYTFTIELPDTGIAPSPTTGDNAFQGSASSVKLTWDGVSCPC